MRLTVLGSAAGGGFPQWNCRCPQCQGARRDPKRWIPRTQSSLWVSGRGDKGVLVNASPDIARQLERVRPLGPNHSLSGEAVRHSCVTNVILTDSQIDHTSGLLFLREGTQIPVHASPQVIKDLQCDFPIFKVLNSFCGVKLHPLEWGNLPYLTFRLSDHPEMEFSFLPMPGKAPRFSHQREGGASPGNQGALRIQSLVSGKWAVYAPSIGSLEDATGQILLEWMRGSQVQLLDGTFWDDLELVQLGASAHTARSMGHAPLGGPNGLLEQLRAYGIQNVVFVHINNTNPLLDSHSSAHQRVKEMSYQVGRDKMEFEL